MDIRDRYNAIQDKEEELKRREAALKKANVNIDDSHPPNFPPFCSTVYHNIGEEIPITMQWTVRIAFIALFWSAAMLVVNMIAACFSGKFSGDYNVAQMVIFAVIYLILTVPLAFKVNYYRFYTQCKKTEITIGYLALQAIYLIFNVIGAAGIKESGMVGIITMIDAIAGDNNGATKAFASIAAVMWILEALVQLFLTGKILVLYKGMGRKLEAQPVAGNDAYNRQE